MDRETNHCSFFAFTTIFCSENSLNNVDLPAHAGRTLHGREGRGLPKIMADAPGRAAVLLRSRHRDPRPAWTICWTSCGTPTCCSRRTSWSRTIPDAILDNEVCSLKHGVYNLGFLGVAPTAEGRRFVDWWAERLRLAVLRRNRARPIHRPALGRPGPRILPHGGHPPRPRLQRGHLEPHSPHRDRQPGRGLHVNGQPLVFFHFSGFDSGAQKTMLDKFGGSIRRSTNSATGTSPSAAVWARTKLGNAVGLRLLRQRRADHRLPPRTYRSRLDVQRAFPDPATAGDVNHSYYHWYGQEQPPDRWHRGRTVASVGRSPGGVGTRAQFAELPGGAVRRGRPGPRALVSPRCRLAGVAGQAVNLSDALVGVHALACFPRRIPVQTAR